MNHGDRANGVVIAGGNRRRALIFLLQRHQANHALAQHGIVDKLDRLFLPNRQRNNRQWVDDHIE